uniref:Fe-S-cluster containining protein n=1 Tax=Candidatus Kentrum sp. LFY TaxID=2126342 RepID=A0A450UGF2_9GAMM|nr:MAG: Fe-S-cluster containining protein [Candidatus Kentron sp. LFY]
MNNSDSLKSVSFECLCEDCAVNCCGPFDGVAPNLQSTQGIKHTKIILLPQDVEQLEEISRDDLISTENGFRFMKTHEDGRCHAFIGGKCEVYHHRPTVCRAYPLYFDMFTGLCVDTNCPGIDNKESINSSGMSHFYDDLVKVYKYWVGI